MKNILALSIISLLLTSCYKETIISPGEGLEDWSATTHSSSAIPNYDIAFPQKKVNRFDITISAEDWETMQNDIDDIYGGTTSGPGGGGPGGGGGGGGTTFSDETPIYIPCNIEFNGLNWYHVGIRYKGNSSLSAYSSDVKKLPFRMEFDEFEDDYPEIRNQTFYGFPALSLSSNYNDQSFLREKVATDLFREFNVPAPYSAFYEIYIDYGDGPIYYGLYTVLEVVFETMLDKQFGSHSGNCYKPEDDGAMFSENGFNLTDFANKTTGGTGENDIQNLYDALQSSNRTSDTSAWKTSLASSLDVNGFLKWLAANTTIQNWDTYGRMPHNYYLYNDPSDNLLKWIPWDNNEALEDGKQGGALSFEFSEISDAEWPLIGYILGIKSYENTFKMHIIDFVSNVFEPTKMEATYSDWQTLIQASVDAESSAYSFLNSSTDFSAAVAALKTHANTRNAVALDYAQ